MRIELQEIPVQDIVRYSKHLKECQGYVDKDEEGVYGMEDRLNIRPIYQREFVYDAKQRAAVMDTVIKGFPLNVLYWVVNKDGKYEVLDGQQRLISIGQYVSNVFATKWSDDGKPLYFSNLTDDQKDRILDYRSMVYFCEGTDSEKIDWFETINIAGEALTNQEIRSAIYSGTWVSDARRYFVRRNCVGHKEGGGLLKGDYQRQDYLETVIKWRSVGKIDMYMAEHQNDKDAEELWEYFEDIVAWVKKTFFIYRKEMAGQPWGEFFNEFGKNELDPEAVERRVAALMEDEEVETPRGIYKYILTGDEKYLKLRVFDSKQKRMMYEKQGGVCVFCDKKFDIDDMEADHIKTWSKGGKTEIENCQMLCVQCNRSKGAK